MSERRVCQKCHRRECQVPVFNDTTALIPCLQWQIDDLKAEVERLKKEREESRA